MNKHVLDYHTRLHDWYRQQSILQERHMLNYDLGLSPPLADGFRNLTKDKFHFINDWCHEVNKALFPVKGKESKNMLLCYNQRLSSSSTKFSSLIDLQKFIRPKSGFFLQSENWDKQSKTILNPGCVQFLENKRIRKVYDIYEHRIGANTLQIQAKPTKNISHIDLCVKNSKLRIPDRNDLFFTDHNSLDYKTKALKHKQNKNNVLLQNIYFLMPNGSSGDDSSQKIYKFTYVRKRGRTPYNDAKRGYKRNIVKKYRHYSRRKVNKNKNNFISDELKDSKSKYLQPETNEKIHEKFGEENNGNKQAIAERADESEQVVPTFGSTRRPTSDHSSSYDFTPAPLTCEDGIHYIQISSPNIKNIDPIFMKRVKNYSQNKVTKMQKEKENLMGKKINHAEEDYIPGKSGTKENVVTIKIDREELDNVSVNIDTEEEDTLYNKKTSKNAVSVKIETEKEDTPFIKKTNKNFVFVKIDKDTITNKEGNVSTGDVKFLNDCNKTAFKTDNKTCIKIEEAPKKVIAFDNVKDASIKNNENNNTITEAGKIHEDVTNEKENRDKCNLEGEMNNSYSINKSQPEGDRRKSMSLTKEPTMNYISLSNNLLNMRSIDDCKISIRYCLAKTNIPPTNQGESISLLTPGKLSSPRKFSAKCQEMITVGDRLETKGITSLFSHPIKSKLVNNKNGSRIFPVDHDFDKEQRPRSSHLDKSFRALISHREIGQTKTRRRKSYSASSVQKEGPVYRRLHTALRKYMEEFVHRRSDQLLSRR